MLQPRATTSILEKRKSIPTENHFMLGPQQRRKLHVIRFGEWLHLEYTIASGVQTGSLNKCVIDNDPTTVTT